MNMKQCPGWNYLHFDDSKILDFFKRNPLEEFPHIVDKFNSFTYGPHKADLFRYYYLYINGGVYLDSDALLNTSIDKIINGNSFVSIEGYYNNIKILFNGFLVCTPRHPIIREALVNAYNIDNDDLLNDYFLICKNLYEIVNRIERDNIAIFQERHSKEFLAGVRTYADEKLILTHYCWILLIPSLVTSGIIAEKVYGLIFRNPALFKLHKYLQRLERKTGLGGPNSRGCL